ncbi:FAD-binding monooxygenase, partial [Thamnocephalis sphaerospora]
MASLPVAVIGAGPTGLMCAVILAELNVPVEIYERNVGPNTEWRAPGIHARTMEMLARYGLADAVLAAGETVFGMVARLNGRLHEGPSLCHMRSEFPMLVSCAQTDTEQILRDRLAKLGVRIHWGLEFVDYAYEASGITAYFCHTATDSDGQARATTRATDKELLAHQCAYLIGCDGGRSRVRKTIGAVFEGKTLDASIAVCDVHMQVSRLPTACFTLHPDGQLITFRVRLNEYRAFVMWTDDPPEMTPEVLAETIRKRMQPEDVGSLQVQSCSQFTINERRASRFISDDKHVFLCGDAAHVHSPAGGQGMNMSMQDAENLAWKLAMVYHGRANADVLDTYAIERIPVADRTIRLSGALF